MRHSAVDKPRLAYFWFCSHLPRSVTVFTRLTSLVKTRALCPENWESNHIKAGRILRFLSQTILTAYIHFVWSLKFHHAFYSRGRAWCFAGSFYGLVSGSFRGLVLQNDYTVASQKYESNPCDSNANLLTAAKEKLSYFMNKKLKESLFGRELAGMSMVREAISIFLI